MLAALLLLCACALAAEPRAETTRTALHVARSLDPDATETLSVRTRGGDVATLVVKKRGGKSNSVPAPVSVTSSSVHVAPDEEPPRDARQLGVPAPVYIRSTPLYVKGEQEHPWKRSRSLIKIDTDGIPVITGVRMPDDESDRHVWRNARVINNILVPADKSKPQNTQADLIRKDQATGIKLENSSFQPVYLSRPTVQKYNTYYSNTRDRIIQYINSINARETARSRMLRRSDGPESEFQARVLQYPASTVYPTSLLYTPASAKPSRVSFEEGVRTPVLQYAHPELGVQPAKVARKQDDFEEEDDSSTRQQDLDNAINKDSTLAYFSQDIHSDRSPYAYEPGMENDEEKPEAISDDRSLYDKRSHGPQEGQDQYWPKKSLGYNIQDDSYGLGNDKYIKRYPYNGYTSYGKDSRYSSPNQQQQQFPPYGHSYFQKVESGRPFWERLGETIKEHVQTSMERVSDLTRPVVEPLVEATQKISHNLGLSTEGGGGGGQSMLQEKVGGAVAAYPVLLPALGLVAGGAALGLGAVAVGRYLDVDMMKRRSTEEEKSSQELSAELSAEHKRAIEQVVRSLAEREGRGDWEEERASSGKADKRSLEDGVLVVLEEGEDEERHRVARRSLDEAEGNALAPPGADPLLGALPGGQAHWNHTPCAKRMFCDVMLHQPADSVILMEKKMATFLALIQRNDAVSFHLSDVMDAVKRRDCSAFTCGAASSGAVDSPARGPGPRRL